MKFLFLLLPFLIQDPDPQDKVRRIEQAIDLLRRGYGERLLISGVNREVRRRELRELTTGSSRLFNCCVDLGFEAEDTVGNAQEIAAWARSKGYDHLIVVTSDYHMPRSLVEIRGQAPGVKLTPYAVSTPSLDNRHWWRATVTARRMTLEYMKYLAALGREAVRRLSRDAPAPAPACGRARRGGGPGTQGRDRRRPGDQTRL